MKVSLCLSSLEYLFLWISILHVFIKCEYCESVAANVVEFQELNLIDYHW